MAGRYIVRERLFGLGDDYWVETDDGRRAFLVDGKAMRMRETLELRGRDGEELFTVKAPLLHLRKSLHISRGGEEVAVVKKALISPFRDKLDVELAGGGSWEVRGDIFDKEYSIDGPEGLVGEVSRRWFSLRDTYGVAVASGHDDALVLAVAVAVERLTEDEDDNNG